MKKKKLERLLRLLLFSAAYFLLLAYCVIFNNNAGWSLWFLLTLLLLLDAAFLLPSLKKVQIILEESIQAETHTAITLPLQVFKYRPTLLPLVDFTLQFDDRFKESHHSAFYRGNLIRLQLPWTPKERGIYEELPVQLYSHDLFGFFEKRYAAVAKQSILILPKLAPEAVTLLPFFKQQVRSQTHGEPNFSIRQFRQYQLGDSLKNIDWKLSGKQQELIYREREHEEEQDIVLLFWGEDHPAFEETLTLFYSIHHFSQNQRLFQPLLIGDGLTSPYQTDAAAYAQILPFEKVPEGVPLLTGSHLVFITPVFTPQLEDYLSQLEAKNSCQVFTYADLMRQLNELEEAVG